ncbi:hypothetical protein PIB30_013229 [Stylosanthes scabra]|uniref:Uncharacterized protein n=1 Tax=Stylosanthes scabra TaxID=79078 RepID=A0ABU6R591_9FABA|nr:hypothetical protein [Stylosanthes scabra]
MAERGPSSLNLLADVAAAVAGEAPFEAPLQAPAPVEAPLQALAPVEEPLQAPAPVEAPAGGDGKRRRISTADEYGCICKVWVPKPQIHIAAGLVTAGSPRNLTLFYCFLRLAIKHRQFWNVTTDNSAKQSKQSSRAGKHMLYTLAFFASAASFFFFFPDEGLKSMLLNSAVTFHFFKWLIEGSFCSCWS